MKGCFLLQRRYAHVGHEIVRALMQEHGLTEVCAYVQVRASMEFLKSQRDVPYTSLLLDEDIHRTYVDEVVDLEYLRRLERDIGNPTLWQYINPDRIIRSSQLVREYPYDAPMYSHEDMLRLTQAYAKKVSNFLDTEKPDFVFMTQPGSLGTLFLYHMARKRGIRTHILLIPGIEGQTTVSDVFERLTGVDAILSRGHIPESYMVRAREALQTFREKPRSYSRLYDAQHVPVTRLRHLEFLTLRGIFRSLRWSVRMLIDWVRATKARHDYSTIQPWYYYLDRIKRKVRNLIGASDLYDQFDAGAYYAFFPLHLEPELALSVLAPFASNQLEVIRNVAQSLPVRMLLYVKEHPLMVAYRPRSFYKTIKNIPNARLLPPSIPGVEVISGAALVCTIAGTSGLEAVQLKKPVISFGKNCYNVLSFVRRSTTPEELPQLIREQLEEFRFDEDELTRFVAAIIEDSTHIDLAYLWAFEHDVLKLRKELRGLVALIARKVGLEPQAATGRS